MSRDGREESGSAMTKEDALDLQATVNGILAQAMGERSRIGGPVNWGDLRCVDVEISLLDGHVTVTVEEASPSALELCSFCGQGAGAARTRRDRGPNGMVTGCGDLGPRRGNRAPRASWCSAAVDWADRRCIVRN